MCTDVGGIGEVVTPGQTGWLVEPGNPRALGDALRRVVDDVPASQHQAAASRARVESEFSVQAILDAYLRIYRNQP